MLVLVSPRVREHEPVKPRAAAEHQGAGGIAIAETDDALQRRAMATKRDEGGGDVLRRGAEAHVHAFAVADPATIEAHDGIPLGGDFGG